MPSLFSSAVVTASLFASTLAAPHVQIRDSSPFPADVLTNDNPSNSQLLLVEQTAHGTPPNGPLPSKLSAAGIANFQLIEFNENFERAYFASLVLNITNNVPGYTINNPKERAGVLEALTAVTAQEDLHALGAKSILKNVGAPTMQPCTYKFPVSTFADAIAFAATFTDVVLGTLQAATESFAENGDTGVPRLIASVIGQEGEQNGYYRVLEKMHKIPSALPFLTTSTGDFAFSALEQNVIVSCPNDSILKSKLKLFGVLELVTQNVQPQDQLLQFSFDLATLAKSNIDGAANYNAKYDWSGVSLVYINQQNVPIVEKLQNVSVQGSKITFSASFPYTANLLNGLTIAALAKGSGPFADATAVSAATIFGPALIEVN